MSVYSKLLKEVKDLILQTPVDIYVSEHDASATNSRYELVEGREVKVGNKSFISKKIGLANLTWAQQHILNVYVENYNPTEKEIEKTKQACDIIFDCILTDLEQQRVLRTFPEIKREETIKLVVDNE